MEKNPEITITMEDGSVMKAELYPDLAPNTVNNFLSLVEKGFLIRSCSNYPGLGDGYYRIAVRSERENALLIKAVKEAV